MISTLLAAAVSIILTGQSNSLSAGTTQAVDLLPDTRPIVVLTPEAGIRDSQEPWRVPGGVTAGRSFARLMSDALPGTQIWMISCGVGSTTAAQWLPNATTGYHQRCVDLAMRAEAFGAPVIAVLWMQGESDCATAEQAELYGDRMTR